MDVVDGRRQRSAADHSKATKMDKRSVTPGAALHPAAPPRIPKRHWSKRMKSLLCYRVAPVEPTPALSPPFKTAKIRPQGSNRLFPEDKGPFWSPPHILENYFRKYVGYDFTADLEDSSG